MFISIIAKLVITWKSGTSLPVAEKNISAHIHSTYALLLLLLTFLHEKMLFRIMKSEPDGQRKLSSTDLLQS